MANKYPGKVAYEAYKKEAVGSELLMTWNEMTLQDHTRWNTIAKAVLNMDKDTKEEKTIGEVAYNNYKDRYNQFGSSKAIWQNLSDTYKNAWEDIAMSVLNHSTLEVKELKTPGQAAWEASYLNTEKTGSEWTRISASHRGYWEDIAKAGYDQYVKYYGSNE